MKKNKEKTPRRLTLSRETIQVLDDPALFGVAGGVPWSGGGGGGTGTTMCGWGGECNP